MHFKCTYMNNTNIARLENLKLTRLSRPEPLQHSHNHNTTSESHTLPRIDFCASFSAFFALESGDIVWSTYLLTPANDEDISVLTSFPKRSRSIIDWEFRCVRFCSFVGTFAHSVSYDGCACLWPSIRRVYLDSSGSARAELCESVR